MAIFLSIAETLIGLVAPELLNRRRVRFTVHRAFFIGTYEEAFFLNLTNLSKDRDIEVTHVWLAGRPPVAAIQPERPLPKRLKPDETWETWIYTSDVPAAFRGDVLGLARARLSTGKELKATTNLTVPPLGTIPGP